MSPNYPNPGEPPGADPHAGWCGAWGEKPPPARLAAIELGLLNYTDYIQQNNSANSGHNYRA